MPQTLRLFLRKEANSFDDLPDELLLMILKSTLCHPLLTLKSYQDILLACKRFYKIGIELTEDFLKPFYTRLQFIYWQDNKLNVFNSQLDAFLTKHSPKQGILSFKNRTFAKMMSLATLIGTMSLASTVYYLIKCGFDQKALQSLSALLVVYYLIGLHRESLPSSSDRLFRDYEELRQKQPLFLRSFSYPNELSKRELLAEMTHVVLLLERKKKTIEDYLKQAPLERTLSPNDFLHLKRLYVDRFFCKMHEQWVGEKGEEKSLFSMS